MDDLTELGENLVRLAELLVTTVFFGLGLLFGGWYAFKGPALGLQRYLSKLPPEEKLQMILAKAGQALIVILLIFASPVVPVVIFSIATGEDIPSLLNGMWEFAKSLIGR